MEYTKEQIQAMKNLIIAHKSMTILSKGKALFGTETTIIGDSIRVLSEPMKEQLSKNKIDIPSA